MLPFLLVGGFTVTSEGLAAVLGGGITLTTGQIVIIVGAVAVGAYVVIHWASNPTIEKYKKEIDNGDGTITVIEKNIRANGDVVFYIWIRDKVTGKTLLFVQLVYNSRGELTHRHEKYRAPGYTGEIPKIDYFNDYDGWVRIS